MGFKDRLKLPFLVGRSDRVQNGSKCATTYFAYFTAFINVPP